MRATVSLDDKLMEYTGIANRAELIREALKSLIAREAGSRLVALGGTDPKMKKIRRTRVSAK